MKVEIVLYKGSLSNSGSKIRLEGKVLVLPRVGEDELLHDGKYYNVTHVIHPVNGDAPIIVGVLTGDPLR